MKTQRGGSHTALTGTFGGGTHIGAVRQVTPSLIVDPPASFNWLAPLKGTPVTYHIERSVDGAAYTEIAQVAANVLTYTDITSTHGHTYNYRVFARNADGDRGAATAVYSFTFTTNPD